jgi:D-alanyl-D-alanine carboxypeptidase
MFCLSGGMIGESSITAYAAGTSQVTSESSSETSSDTKVEIGKATPASNYITAKDWPEGPSIGAEGAVLMEAETGTVLFAKNPDTQMYPASITKIMTALLTLEDSELTDTMVFEGEAFRELPANYTYYTVSEGEEWTIEDALCGLMMKSYNNVANALAVHDAGTIAAFAEKMNERAVQAGAKNTHFNNPSGEHEENHYTTPYDMAMIMRDCVQIEAFVDIAGRKVHTLQPTNKRSSEDTIYALHKMLFPSSEHYYEYCVCGKTGYTDQARNTLVTYAEKDGMKLICVVMGCGLGVQYADTETLFNFGFDNFSVIDASDSDERFTLKDEGIFASGDMASSTSFNIEIPEQSFVVLPSGVSLSKVDTNIQYLTDTEDGYFAEIDYLYEGMTVGSARLKMTDATPADGESFDFDSHAEQEESEAAESQGDGGLGDIWSRTKNIDVRVVIVEVVGIILIIAICIIRRIRKKDDRIRFDKKRKRRR